MCMYCEKIATTTISDNGTCYHDRPSRMNGNFIRYNCDADEFVLMNSNEKVICCMDYCPCAGVICIMIQTLFMQKLKKNVILTLSNSLRSIRIFTTLKLPICLP